MLKAINKIIGLLEERPSLTSKIYSTLNQGYVSDYGRINNLHSTKHNKLNQLTSAFS